MARMPKTKKTSTTLAYYKPTQARAQKTFRHILDVSLSIIENENVGALNTNRVADECGINIGTLYHYFPNKDVIILALYQGWYDQTIAYTEERRRNLRERSNARQYYKNVILDVISIDGFSCQSAVELERAMKLRPELAEREDEMTEQMIGMYEKALVVMVPNVCDIDRMLHPAMMLSAVWGALTIAAEVEADCHEDVADNAAIMIAALVKSAKENARG